MDEQPTNDQLREAAVGLEGRPADPAFFRAFLDSSPFVPLEGDTPIDDDGRMAPDAELTFPVAVADDGSSWIPLFTTTDALVAWRPEGDAVAIGGRDLAGLIDAGPPEVAGLVLDPAGPAVVPIPRGVLRALAQGEVPASAELPPQGAPQEIVVGRPQEPFPPEFVEAVAVAAGAIREIGVASLALVSVDGAPPRPGIGIGFTSDADPGLAVTAADRLLLRLRPALPAGGEVDVVELEGDLEQAFAEQGDEVFRRGASDAG
jgi:hypothetical protein